MKYIFNTLPIIRHVHHSFMKIYTISPKNSSRQAFVEDTKNRIKLCCKLEDFLSKTELPFYLDKLESVSGIHTDSTVTNPNFILKKIQVLSSPEI